MRPTDELLAVHESLDQIAGTEEPIRAERFEPIATGENPGVLLLHGADGLAVMGETYRAMARDLAGRGFRVFLVHYFGTRSARFSPAFINPIQFLGWMQTVQQALEHAARQPRTKQVGIVGISLGAYLALALASRDERVRAVVEWFGGLPDILGANLQRMPPVLILHGERDWIVAVSEARKLERLLRDRNLPHELHIYPDQGHGFTGRAFEDAFQRSFAFLEKHLK